MRGRFNSSFVVGADFLDLLGNLFELVRNNRTGLAVTLHLNVMYNVPLLTQEVIGIGKFWSLSKG